MSRTLKTLLPCVVLLAATAAPAAELPPPELASSLTRLSASLDRLSAALEKNAARSDDASAGQRVQVAVGILGLRMRKVDRLEGEVRGLANEGEEIRNQMEIMKTQFAENDDQRRLEGREMTPEERAMRTQMDVFLVTMEARIRTLDERKSALEAELDAQLRGLSRLEAMLEDWMKQQP
jgi:hypothetical protein